MRCSEPGVIVAVAIVASRGPVAELGSLGVIRMNVTKPQMAAPLQSILDQELARGNEVVEVGSWPPKCRLLVLLRSPFYRDYSPVPEVEFALINDPHYWQGEYRYRGGEQTLACGFA